MRSLLVLVIVLTAIAISLVIVFHPDGLNVSLNQIEEALQSGQWKADQNRDVEPSSEKLIQRSDAQEGRPESDNVPTKVAKQSVQTESKMGSVQDENISDQEKTADDLVERGRKDKDVQALRNAKNIYESLLRQYSPKKQTADWARMQYNLGKTHFYLAESEGNAEIYKQSVANFRHALSVYSCESNPSKWRILQSNLGDALVSLGRHQQESKYYKKGIEAYNEALKVLRKGGSPKEEWLRIQRNMGVTLLLMGKTEKDRAYIKQGIKELRDALKIQSKKSDPADWAETHIDIGNAFRALGQITNDRESYKQAIRSYRASLQVYTLEKYPRDHAETNLSIGETMQTLGELEMSARWFKKAVVSYGKAFNGFRRVNDPFNCAMAQNQIGIAYTMRGKLLESTECLNKALVALNSALKILEDGNYQKDAEVVRGNIDYCRLTMSQVKQNRIDIVREDGLKAAQVDKKVNRLAKRERGRQESKDGLSLSERKELIRGVPELAFLTDGLPAYYVHVTYSTMPLWDNEPEMRLLLKKVKATIDSDARIESRPYGRKRKFTVYCGPFGTKMQAGQMAKRIKDAGYEYYFKFTPNP